jgi:hypothetical protein
MVATSLHLVGLEDGTVDLWHLMLQPFSCPAVLVGLVNGCDQLQDDFWTLMARIVRHLERAIVQYRRLTRKERKVFVTRPGVVMGTVVRVIYGFVLVTSAEDEVYSDWLPIARVVLTTLKWARPFYTEKGEFEMINCTFKMLQDLPPEEDPEGDKLKAFRRQCEFFKT